MPKPDERGGLMNLRMPLPKAPPVEAAEAAEDRILHGQPDRLPDAQPEVRPSLRTDVKTLAATAATATALAPARPPREGTILLNAKIPISLHTRLKRTAQFNDISMTEILLRALAVELESPAYVRPPDHWGA